MAMTDDTTPYVRLHVTPLDDELLKVVLSAALLPKARNISYHAIDTFPEKRYGFVELPNEDAEKLRKKLNGSVLKGVKIRIERARPSRVPAPLAEEAMAREKSSKRAAEDGVRPKDKRDKSKKRKRDAEELSGVVLENGRTLKRGWTTPDDEPKEKRSKKSKDKSTKSKEKKKQTKSKYTDHAECLAKAVLPQNAVPTTDAEQSTPTKKKKKGRSREVTVHEFEKTTKFPSFIRAATSKGRPGAPLEFVDGKGWVDEGGNVVEAIKARPMPSAKVLLSSRAEDQRMEDVDDHENATSSSDDEDTGQARSRSESPAAGLSVTGSAESEEASPSPQSKLDPPRPRSSGSVKSLSIKIPPATPNESKVHPLEALYKRTTASGDATPKRAPDAQGFSFFADGNEESVDEDGVPDGGDASGIQIPMTPFTRQDLELRGVRSAAPTPDTAHPSRRFAPWEPEKIVEEQDDDESVSGEIADEIMSDDATADGPGESDEKPTSDFQKSFWESRGDTNRSWRKRRKLAGKERRYRENKARMARAI